MSEYLALVARAAEYRRATLLHLEAKLRTAGDDARPMLERLAALEAQNLATLEGMLAPNAEPS